MAKRSDKYIITSNPVFHKRFRSWLIALIVLLAIAYWFLISGLTHKPFANFTDLIVSLIFFIVFSVVLIYVTGFKRVKFIDTQLIVKSLIGKQFIIERKKIKSFYELNYEVETKSGIDKWDEMLLFTDRDVIEISSKIQPDYIQLREFLTKGIPEYKNEEIYNRYKTIRAALKKTILLFLLGIVCITSPLVSFFYIKYVKSDITYDQVKELKGITGNFPQRIMTGKHIKKEIGIRIELQEYPYFKFNFYERAFVYSSYEDFRNSIVSGRSIAIYISLDEYKKKISKELPIKFNDKYFNFNNIETFGAEYNGRTWRTGYTHPLNKSEQEELYYLKIFVLFVLLGGFLLSIYYGFRFWKEYKELLVEQKLE